MIRHDRLDIFPASRHDVERRLLVRVPHILVSIRDCGSPTPRLRYNGLRRAVLFLEFDDAEPVANFSLPPDVRLMTRADADAIWSLVLRHRNEVDAAVVHCEQGMSRSPAVAAGLLKGLGQSDEDIWGEYQPNSHVLRLICETRPEATGPREQADQTSP